MADEALSLACPHTAYMPAEEYGSRVQLQEFWPQGSPQIVRGRNTAPYVSPLPAVFGPGPGMGATPGGPPPTSGVSSPASSDDGCFADDDAEYDAANSLHPVAGECQTATPSLWQSI